MDTQKQFGKADSPISPDSDFDILIVAGQSNAEGYGRGSKALAFVPHDPIYTYSVQRGVYPAEDIPVGRLGTRSGFWQFLAELYVRDGRLPEDRKLLVLNSAVGGTGFADHQWGVGEPLSERLYKWIGRFSRNPNNRFIAALWHQGEREVVDKVGRQTHYRNMQLLLNGIRDAVGFDLPFVCGDMTESWRQENPACAEITQAQMDLTQNNARCAFVGTDGVESNRWPDNIHFSRKGNIELAGRYYEKMVGLLDGLGNQPDGK